MPGMVARVLTFDLGEARTLRTHGRLQPHRGHRAGAAAQHDAAADDVAAHHRGASGWSVGVWLSTRVGLAAGPLRVLGRPRSPTPCPAGGRASCSSSCSGSRCGCCRPAACSARRRPRDPLGRLADLLYHAILPILTLVLVSIGPSIYVVRTMTLTVAQDDHVTLARAKGMAERHRAAAAHPAGRGAAHRDRPHPGPRGHRSAASILVETVFEWQGMGRLYYDAIAGTPDEGLIVALTFMFTLLYVIARLILEVLYVFLDPRVRYDDGRARRCLGRSCALRGRAALGAGLAVVLCVARGLRRAHATRPTSGRQRWSDPTVWADNPKAAPPAWTNLLGRQPACSTGSCPPTEPAEVSHARARRRCARTRCPSRYAEDEPPTLPLVPAGRGDLPAAGRRRTRVVLVRPDGRR